MSPMNNRLLVPRKVPGLLDLVPGAAAAYSLRRLSRSYAGPVVPVRRSSDNAEDSFTAAEVADGTLAAFAGAGDAFVKTWHNQAGSVDISQSTAGSQPKIVSSGVLETEEGKAAIRFDGVDDTLSSPGGFIAPAFPATEYLATVAIVAKTALATYGHSGAASFCNIGFGGTNPRLYFGMGTSYTAGHIGCRIGDTTAYNFAYPIGTDSFLLTIAASASNAACWVNGVQNLSITPTTGAVSGHYLSIGGDASGYWTGTFQEVIFYNSDLFSQRELIEGNIAWSYSV